MVISPRLTLFSDVTDISVATNFQGFYMLAKVLYKALKMSLQEFLALNLVLQG